MPSRLIAALAPVLTAIGILSAMAAQASDSMLKITGELTYLARIALPPDSLAIVEIRAADAPEEASVLVEARINLNGRQVPVPFTIEVERARFEEGKTYLLHGGILDGLRISWISDTVEIDPAAEAINAGVMRMKPFRAPPPFGMVKMEEIQDIEWVVEDISGDGIIDSSRATLNFGKDGSLAGRATCNTYRATYTHEDTTLSVGPVATTRMACPEALMKQEQKFLDILGGVKRYRMAPDGALVLEAENGSTLTARRAE